MKKDLIMIGTYCPDKEREDLLVNCIDSLKECRDKYDLLIVSHSYIPEYIARNVDYVIFDKENDLLINDTDYLNKPWFRPMDNYIILSSYIGQYSTFLSAYRILIAGIGFAKTYLYNKIHFIEYDTKVTDINEIYENSDLLDNYDAVFYNSFTNENNNGDNWYQGNFLSFNLKSVPEIFQKFDRDKLLKILKESNRKSNEYFTYLFFNEKNENIYLKDFDYLKDKMITALSDFTSKEDLNYWTVPFYDRTENVLKVITWNNKDAGPINVNYIINDKILITHNINIFAWKIDYIGNCSEVNKITCIVNDKIKYTINLNEENIETFKNSSYGESIN